MGAGEEREADPGNVTDDGEIELNLPREVMEEQDRPCEDIRESPGAAASGATAMSQEDDIGWSSRMGPDRNGPDTDGHVPLWRCLVVQSWGLWRMWVVPERIGRDGNRSSVFPAFQQHRQKAGVMTPTQVNVERNRDFWGPGVQLPKDATTVGVGIPYANPDRRHSSLLKWPSLMERLAGNNTNRCLTLLCCPMDGMT